MGGSLSSVDDTCCTFQAVQVCTDTLAIGTGVTGGVANAVLYEDASQNLAATADFTYDAVDSVLSILGAIELRSDPTAPISGAGNVRLRSNAGVLEASQNGGAYAAVGGGAMAIGGAVAGGAATNVLYVNGGGLLAQDADFVYNAGAIGLGFSTSTGAVSVVGSLAAGDPLTVLSAGGNLVVTHTGTNIETGTFYNRFTATLTQIEYEDTTNASVLDVLDLRRSTSNVPQNNIGVAQIYSTENSAGAAVTAARQSVTLTTGTAASEVSSWALSVLDAGALVTPLTVTANDMSFTRTSSTTNTVLDMFVMTRTTTGAAAAGIGMGMAYYLENAAGTTILGAREGVSMTTVTAGAEDVAIDFSVVQNGALLSNAVIGGALRGVHVPSGSRFSIGTSTTSLWFVNISGNVATYQTGSTSNGHAFRAAASTSGSRTMFDVLAVANTGQTAGAEIEGVHFDLSATRTWANGAIATQREFKINAPTYAFTTVASVITDAATFYVSGAPIAGALATITNAYSIWSDAGRIRLDGIGIALGGGAAPTLGTIGGTGPAAAAQNQWLEVTVDGTRNWIPAWQ